MKRGFFFHLTFSLFLVFLSCEADPLNDFDLLELADSPASSHEQVQATLIKEGKLPEVKGLIESSGLAVLAPSLFSYPCQQLVITHNDSFSNKKLFGFGFVNNELQFLFQTQLNCPAFNFDWEDSCTLGLGRIAIADCGDNLKIRRFLSIYFLDFRPVAPYYTLDPQILKPQPFLLKMNARFPGSPAEQKNFNVESVFQFQGKLYFFTKEKKGSRLFALDLPTSAFDFAFGEKLPQKEFQQESKVEELLYCGAVKTTSIATAADFHIASMRIALLTYKRVYLYGLKSGISLNEGDFLQLKDFQCLCEVKIDPKHQWESVCFLAENQLLVGSEDSHYAIYSLALKP